MLAILGAPGAKWRVSSGECERVGADKPQHYPRFTTHYSHRAASGEWRVASGEYERVAAGGSPGESVLCPPGRGPAASNAREPQAESRELTAFRVRPGSSPVGATRVGAPNSMPGARPSPPSVPFVVTPPAPRAGWPGARARGSATPRRMATRPGSVSAVCTAARQPAAVRNAADQGRAPRFAGRQVGFDRPDAIPEARVVRAQIADVHEMVQPALQVKTAADDSGRRAYAENNPRTAMGKARPAGRWRAFPYAELMKRTRSTWTSSGCATKAWKTRRICRTWACSRPRS
jgi:hypothetical protein